MVVDRMAGWIDYFRRILFKTFQYTSFLQLPLDLNFALPDVCVLDLEHCRSEDDNRGQEHVGNFEVDPVEGDVFLGKQFIESDHAEDPKYSEELPDSVTVIYYPSI